MKKEKKVKILKISAIFIFIAIIVLIIVMCIVSAKYKNDTERIKNENQQIEQILDDTV